jgi:acyl-coenzyme A synthetase/AMP-(fatty) acid ligase
MAIPTSGSTGQPKMVATSWDRIENGLCAVTASQGLEQLASTGLLLPPHYSFALVNQVLWSVWKGAELVITPGLASPGDALKLIKERRVEMVCMVGGQLRALLKLGFGAERFNMPDVKVINFAGGPFPADCFAGIRLLFPNARINNNYGCTEAFPRLTMRRVLDAAEPIGDVGLPIKGIELQIRTEEGLLASGGELGAIYARGPSSALGILTAAGELEPFSAEGWFATGDRGLLQTNGHLQVCGRADQIIKVGGERISLLKIEEVLRRLAGIEDAIVVGERDVNGEQWAMACVLTEQAPGQIALRRHLSCCLPMAGWPRKVYSERAWPMLSNGKPDRKSVIKRAREGQAKLIWTFNQAV